MNHRKIRNVMTTDVVSVSEHKTFKDIARLLAGHGVSAVPVVDDQHRVIGVVSNADLLAKQGHYEGLRLVRRRRARAKAAATAARDLMTTPAITIGPESTIVHGAKLLARHNIKRLPVVDDNGGLVGIVARQDLLNVFLRADQDIRAEIVHDVFEHGLGVTVNPTTAQIEVHDGIVTVLGELQTKSLVTAAEALTRRVDGVVDVHNKLRFVRDDTHPVPPDVPMIGSIRAPQGGRHA